MDGRSDRGGSIVGLTLVYLVTSGGYLVAYWAVIEPWALARECLPATRSATPVTITEDGETWRSVRCDHAEPIPWDEVQWVEAEYFVLPSLLWGLALFGGARRALKG